MTRARAPLSREQLAPLAARGRLGGLPGEQDGETPATFKFEASVDGPAISETSTYRLRLSRRRTEVVLDWAGKLAFVRTLRHPTRDPAPCLRAELEIPKARHSLH